MAAMTATAAAAAKSVASTTSAAAAVAATSPAAPAAIRLATPAAATAVAFTSESALRKQIKFETVKWDGEKVKTLDEESRILLAQAAAAKAGLHQVGLSFEDVYGVIEAETSWIPRTGMGKNGVTSIGLAQFEPRTARGLGLKDPNDPVQAVMAAAVNMKHGAEWAADRLDDLKLSPEQYQAKLREGVSVYYNLSVKGRNKWNGLNTEQLPVETQRHIRNVRAGAAEASELAGKLLDT
jgi:soluble lytic murein transglycosylase-like protein